VYLKDETGLPTGSFKVRGALCALQAATDRGSLTEVVAASTGNHGAAVAWAARLLGVPARIFLPASPNPIKAARIRTEGATLVEAGRDLSAAIDAAERYCAATGSFFLHDASSPDVPAGTATIAAEILEDLPAAATDVSVYVPMGDTALIRGIASAMRHASHPPRVVGVVAERAPAYFLSWRAGMVVETETADTIADGLAVRRPLGQNVAAICELVDEVIAVGEDEMLRAMAALRETMGIVAEPSGAAALAAVLKDHTASGRLIALVTGGNISPDIAHRNRGTQGTQE
jgi:threonine dehydratase